MFEVTAYHGMVNSVLLIIQAAENEQDWGDIYARAIIGKELLLGPIQALQSLFQLLLQDWLHEQARAKVSLTRQGVEQQAHYDHTHRSSHFTGPNACCVAYYLTLTEVSIARTS
jgi:hypothetical protein